MKRATGSKARSESVKVSIQLKLGGHSFSADALPGSVPADAEVEVEVLTPKTTLVPEMPLDEASAARCLALCGAACGDDETAVWSRPAEGRIAVMAVAAEALARLRERFGDRLRPVSPLLAGRAETDGIRLHAATGVLYIMVYDGGLQLAEAIPAAGSDDELCALQRLRGCFDIDRLALRLSGERTQERRKILGRYYREVTCES